MIAPEELDVAVTATGASPEVWFGTEKLIVSAIVNFLKRTEGADVYDAGTNLSPFASEQSSVPQPRRTAHANAAALDHLRNGTSSRNLGSRR